MGKLLGTLGLATMCGFWLFGQQPQFVSAQGVSRPGAVLDGPRFGQGSGSRRGYGCCCCSDPEPAADPGPAVECNPQCPSAHEKIFQCDGRKYKQFCGIHVATDTLRDFDVPGGYQECFQACVDDPQCQALDYTSNHCWLKQEGVDPPPKPMPSDQDISIIFLP